jgi:hypothetical protein
MATSKAKKPFHLIRITKEIFNDLMIWKMFVDNFNGTSFILDISEIDHEKGHQQHSYWQTKYEKLSYGNVPSLIYKL